MIVISKKKNVFKYIYATNFLWRNFNLQKKEWVKYKDSANGQKPESYSGQPSPGLQSLHKLRMRSHPLAQQISSLEISEKNRREKKLSNKHKYYLIWWQLSLLMNIFVVMMSTGESLVGKNRFSSSRYRKLPCSPPHFRKWTCWRQFSSGSIRRGKLKTESFIIKLDYISSLYSFYTKLSEVFKCIFKVVCYLTTVS